MAEAQKTTRTVVEKTFTLTLSVDEAETLMAVGAKIAGDQVDSPRKHFEAIVRALGKAGARDFTASKYEEHPHRLLTGGLTFKNNGTAAPVDALSSLLRSL
ncbi:hypothetical protein [Streptomyces wuyuanensis]|uniref:hypothetical protein n=1 Tax=Streptomyces wuyuanensis TaxID=1196353 RepID=UPI00343408A0